MSEKHKINKLQKQIIILQNKKNSSTTVNNNTTNEVASETLMNKQIANQKIVDGQVLIYDERTDTFKPGTVTTDLTGYIIGTGISTIVKLTQAEYDALTPVETTLYIIVG